MAWSVVILCHFAKTSNDVSALHATKNIVIKSIFARTKESTREFPLISATLFVLPASNRKEKPAS
jgi:hypothetical protein